jgi:tRNA A-37 threonylcarbamoyl transferase component Bud32
LFWLECHRLLLGIKELLKHNIVHNDLKAQNIVYSESKNRINFIDFSLMKNIKKEKKKL